MNLATRLPSSQTETHKLPQLSQTPCGRGKETKAEHESALLVLWVSHVKLWAPMLSEGHCLPGCFK